MAPKMFHLIYHNLCTWVMAPTMFHLIYHQVANNHVLHALSIAIFETSYSRFPFIPRKNTIRCGTIASSIPPLIHLQKIIVRISAYYPIHVNPITQIR